MEPAGPPIDVKTVDGRVVITPLAREITFKNTRDFLRKAKNIVAETGGEGIRYILDLRNIEIIDSVSLGTLVAILKYVRDKKGELVVANLAEPIRDIFELLHFGSVFKIYNSLEDALKD